MKYLAMDIETAPDPSRLHLVPPPEVDKRLKDPEKIERAREEATQKQHDKLALSPYTGRIISCHFAWFDRSVGNQATKTSVIVDPQEQDRQAAEKQALLIIMDQMAMAQHVVTYNGHRFDFPFLARRASMCGVHWPMDYARMTRYQVADWDCRHWDIYQYFDIREGGLWSPASRSLVNMAILLLSRPQPKDIADAGKAQYSQWYEDGGTRALALLKKAGEWDAETTLLLARMILEAEGGVAW